jgi:hypothetical protein
MINSLSAAVEIKVDMEGLVIGRYPLIPLRKIGGTFMPAVTRLEVVVFGPLTGVIVGLARL